MVPGLALKGTEIDGESMEADGQTRELHPTGVTTANGPTTGSKDNPYEVVPLPVPDTRTRS